MNIITNKSCQTIPFLVDRIRSRQEKIHEWLNAVESGGRLCLYSSVDIRDAGFKAAVVDTNIFPAGFNNLCEHGLADSVAFIRDAVLRRVPEGKNIIIVAEEHTRNTWYLENVRILQEIISQAGFNVKIATFLEIQPKFCETMNYVELETATGHPVKIYCFQKILSKYISGEKLFDMIILNNDLTKGIPDILKNSEVPIYPSVQAGWHSRHKSRHFSFTSEIVNEFAKIIDVDPWLFSCLFQTIEKSDINIDPDRELIAEKAATLLEQIKQKYKQHDINEKPYLLLKADSGTYGMGVIAVEEPNDIRFFNRRNRNNLSKGKSGMAINRFILQEGVPTIYNIGHQVSEVCIYQIENNFVGGFYRAHSGKTERQSLNSKGMEFKKMCPHSGIYGECGVHHDVNIFDLYRILARIACVAAQREIVQLEAKSAQ